MLKAKTVYVCNECGAGSPKWLGKCPDCGAWNSFAEEVSRVASQAVVRTSLASESISTVSGTDDRRLSTGDPSLDRVLGGGLVPGSLTLIGGEPGVGKSTLLTQLCGKVAESHPALYVSGEETAHQVKLRAERLGAVQERFRLASSTSADEVADAIARGLGDVIVVDSIQTVVSDGVDSIAGSISQVRHSAGLLQQAAKGSKTAVIIVGHVTKDGQIAGPKLLEHTVDTVLTFEGEGHGRLRTLRCTKNRFGSTDELAVYEMTSDGLEAVENPSAALLAERQADASGSAVFAALEGTRPLLVEIQALVTPNYTNSPRRTVTGLDYNRAQLVLSVMEKRCGLRLGAHDVFLNVAGGLQIREPAADLAMFLAVASSLKDIAVPSDLVAFGEIGLTGEIRSVSGADLRFQEAARMGFARAAVSKNTKDIQKAAGLRVGGLRNVQDALGVLGI